MAHERIGGGSPSFRFVTLGCIVANILLQKLAIPGTAGVLPLSLLITFILLGAAVATGRMTLFVGPAVALVPTLGILIFCSGITPAGEISISALALLATHLVPYIFAFQEGKADPAYPQRLIVNLATALSIAGVAQFTLQFILGPGIAFYLDFNLNRDWLLAGFNNLNETSYLSGIYKANGIFLLEPAFLNQLICVAVIIEILGRCRWQRLAVFAAGILATYSGTGLLMLLVIAPVYIVKTRNVALGAACIGALTALLLAQSFGFQTFLDRADEFSSNQSSAFARFLSIFRLLEHYVWNDPATLLVGRGPGSVSQFFSSVGFTAFDPSWGKIMYEYGLIGFTAYFGFLVYCISRSPASGYLKAALLFQFLFLGGYVSTSAVHFEMWTLLVWPALTEAPRISGSSNRLQLRPFKEQPA